MTDVSGGNRKTSMVHSLRAATFSGSFLGREPNKFRSMRSPSRSESVPDGARARNREAAPAPLPPDTNAPIESIRHRLHPLLSGPPSVSSAVMSRTTFGTSQGPRQPEMVSWIVWFNFSPCQTALIRSTGTSGNPRSVRPQQQPLQRTSCPKVLRFVCTVAPYLFPEDTQVAVAVRCDSTAIKPGVVRAEFGEATASPAIAASRGRRRRLRKPSGSRQTGRFPKQANVRSCRRGSCGH